MSTLFLNSSDFALNGDMLMCKKTPNLLLVLFYSTNCPHCGPARDIVSRVAMQFMQGNCKFGMINITQNPKVTQLSRASKTPITYVPFVLAFFNGEPLAKYSGGGITAPNLIHFVQQCQESVKDRIDAFGAANMAEEIPAYTTGFPVCDDNVCYLGYESAYGS